MKVLKKVLIGVGAVLVVLIVVVVLFLGQVVKTTVEKVGPQVTGVDVSLERARVYLLLGDIKLKGLVIGNPEGFKTPSAMELGRFVIDLDMGSLFTDTIVIKEILIDGPQVTYERALRSSNLGQIQKNMEPKEKDKPAKETKEGKPAKADKGPGKKIVIEDFLFENGQIHVSTPLAGGKDLTVPLPKIHLEDIGKGSGGASVSEVVNQLFGAIAKSAGKAVASSADIADDAGKVLKDVGGDATDAAKELSGSAADAAKGVGGSIKKLGGSLFGGKK